MAITHIKIDGKTFQIPCQAQQEGHLALLAYRFEDYILQLKKKFKDVSDYQLAIMAGIVLMDEKIELEKKIESLKKDNQNINSPHQQTHWNQNPNSFSHDEAELAKHIAKIANFIEDITEEINKQMHNDNNESEI